MVGAIDHSEVVARELHAASGEDKDARSARIRRWIEARVPDLRFLLDRLLGGDRLPVRVAGETAGAVGHSFGGWTVLEAAVTDDRIASVVALAPAGGGDPRPGILPVTATLRWQRDVPVLYVAAENDASISLESVAALRRRTAGARMIVLANADHLHFVDDVELRHEAVRGMTLGPELAWLKNAMRPIGELLPGAQAHRLVRGYALAHFDATLKARPEAAAFWNLFEGE